MFRTPDNSPLFVLSIGASMIQRPFAIPAGPPVLRNRRIVTTNKWFAFGQLCWFVRGHLFFKPMSSIGTSNFLKPRPTHPPTPMSRSEKFFPVQPKVPQFVFAHVPFWDFGFPAATHPPTLMSRCGTSVWKKDGP